MVVAACTRPGLTARLPLGKAVVLAAIWVAATVLAGALGMVLAESVAERRPSGPPARTLLAAAPAWILMAPLLLCWLRGSAWAIALGAWAAAAMAVCVRGMTGADKTDPVELWEPEEPGPHFADLPAPDSRRPEALAIAVCVEGAAVLANRGAIFTATALMAAGSFLFVWKGLRSLGAKPSEGMARPAERAASATLAAMLILIPLLMARFARVEGGGIEATAQAAARPRADAEKVDPNDAYQGIILFTVKDKEKDLPPVPLERDLLRTGKAQPLVIRFDGAYWYFQAPKRGPGMHPHFAHGDPVAVSIYSTGWVPLAMQAHQTLAQPADLRSCGAMRVTVRNGDNRQGSIDMGVLLTDTTVTGKPSLYLGTKPIVSTEPGHFAFKPRPVTEELTFAIPAYGGLKKFDDITVLFFPDEERLTLGARIGIDQFELMPK
jgi:hypothetical protein